NRLPRVRRAQTNPLVIKRNTVWAQDRVVFGPPWGIALGVRRKISRQPLRAKRDPAVPYPDLWAVLRPRRADVVVCEELIGPSLRICGVAVPLDQQEMIGPE